MAISEEDAQEILLSIKYPIGSWVILLNGAPKRAIPLHGKVEGHCGPCLVVRPVGYKHPRMPLHTDVKPAVWCEHGRHWSPGIAEDDYKCMICRKWSPIQEFIEVAQSD